MQEITQKVLTGERALFGATGLRITDCVFDSGESPLKESSDLELKHDLFRWKYPLWYAKNVIAEECTLFDMARAGIWYSKNITFNHAVIQAPKAFRRCDEVTLNDVVFTNASETLWNNTHVHMKDVKAKGDYFAMGCSDMEIDGLVLDGNYSFDGVKNTTIRNSQLLSRDAFWNTENVTAINCFITGEYLGWNSKNLTLIDCTIESEQGMCYCENLKMVNCHLFNTTLAFEYSNVDASLTGRAQQVFNPASGRISIDEIGELIIEDDKVDPKGCQIACEKIEKRSDRPEWLVNKDV